MRKVCFFLMSLLLATSVIGLGMAMAASTNAPAHTPPVAGGPFVVAKITDLERHITFKVFTPAEYNDLKKSIAAEAFVFLTAVELAKQAWPIEGASTAPASKTSKTAGSPTHPAPLPPFPSSMLSPRTLQDCGVFPEKAEADKKLRELESIEKREIAGGGTKNKPRVPKNVAEEQVAESNAVVRAGTILKEKIDALLKPPAAPAAAKTAADSTTHAAAVLLQSKLDEEIKATLPAA